MKNESGDGRFRLLERPWCLSLWCVVAAFGTYACMFGFRKPFTAAAYATDPYSPGFKDWMVIAQVLGYATAKFIGIKVIAEMPPGRRATMILVYLGAAHAAFLLFAVLPPPWSLACLYLNGMPLGMVFGLVLGALEGRRMTEAFVAGLCASFILADGFTKSVGTVLLGAGIGDPWMPFCAGLLFVPPLCLFVWMLRQVPAPSSEDVASRSERAPMSGRERRALFRRHAPGLVCITAAYLLVTIQRGIRSDFAPELWAGLGAPAPPSVFTWSETLVALGVMAANGLMVLVRDNRRAFFLALATCGLGLCLIWLVIEARAAGRISPFSFMVLIGLGLYLPYVAVHTTIFERLIAMTRDRGNIGYLMYVVDAIAWLGYAGVVVGKRAFSARGDVLGFFAATGRIVAAASLVGIIGAWVFFALRGTGCSAAPSALGEPMCAAPIAGPGREPSAEPR